MFVNQFEWLIWYIRRLPEMMLTTKRRICVVLQDLYRDASNQIRRLGVQKMSRPTVENENSHDCCQEQK